MKKKKNLMLMICLLVGIVALGIGYAISTQELTINGSATASQAADTAFNVYFSNAVAAADTETTSSTASIDENDATNRTAKMAVSLKAAGDSQSATFTVKNDSQEGISAKISAANVKIYKKGTTEAYSSEYFDIETSITEDVTIAKGATTTFTVTVTLKKANVGDTDITEEFDVVLENVEAVQA